MCEAVLVKREYKCEDFKCKLKSDRTKEGE